MSELLSLIDMAAAAGTALGPVLATGLIVLVLANKKMNRRAVRLLRAFRRDR